MLASFQKGFDFEVFIDYFIWFLHKIGLGKMLKKAFMGAFLGTHTFQPVPKYVFVKLQI